MFKKLALKITAEELKILSQFFVDISKAILGVPVVAYFISGISPILLITGFILDFIVVILCLFIAFKLGRIAKRRQDG